ncbi:MAG: M23 family metallopeptidase [Bacteroidia bacterium]|nr:M23 family metallopeptidase [Bacteroidia bacterium]MDW8015277.1 M23 family metallopeptidase [Bacteroidia bacterium]
MAQRQYRFFPRQLEFRRLPRWQTLRIGHWLMFLIGVGIGAWVVAYFTFRWRPSPTVRAALHRQKTEEYQLSVIQMRQDSIQYLTQATDSIERHIYHQLVPMTPLDKQKKMESQPLGKGFLSEDTLSRYLARTEEMLRSLVRAEAVLQSPELRSPHLPRLLPCECKEIGAGVGSLIHPLTEAVQKHEGIDFLTSENTIVLATAEGLVRGIETSRPGEGARILIQHSPTLLTVYYPVNPQVQVGQWISAGSIIGTVARLSVGKVPFLHYEVRVADEATDPFPYLWGQMSWEERLHWKQVLALQSHGLH